MSADAGRSAMPENRNSVTHNHAKMILVECRVTEGSPDVHLDVRLGFGLKVLRVIGAVPGRTLCTIVHGVHSRSWVRGLGLKAHKDDSAA